MTRAFVALGSNIEPEARLIKAARLLRASFPDVQFSHCFSNAAVGFVGEDFINAVAGFSCPLPIPALIDRLHAIEEQCDRARDAPKWAPREMDIDLLLYGEHVGDGPGYRVPRPDLLQRPYMLGPLAELAPQLKHPVEGAAIGTLWAGRSVTEHELVRCPPDLNAA